MDLNDPLASNINLQAQEILLAATIHDIPKLRDLLRTGSASVQDPETGMTPLHAVVASCEKDDEEHTNGVNGAPAVNDHVNGESATGEAEENDPDMVAAAQTLRFLLQNGAIWNDLDSNDETPGCLAHRLGLTELYDIIVDAGVRAELLLSRLDEYQPLDDDDDDAIEGGNDESNATEAATAAIEAASSALARTPERISGDQTPSPPAADVNSTDYLAADLSFTADRLVDADKNGVMMSWETEVMRRSAELLTPSSGLRVLNVGHGMGIIDDIFQTRNASEHHIIEAHPAIFSRMRKQGWYDKPGVTIHEGKWQDIMPKFAQEGIMFDVIYFDTFAEEYKALRTFFSEWVVQVLDPAGRFGFFNGMGADRQVCYDVYNKSRWNSSKQA